MPHAGPVKLLVGEQDAEQAVGILALPPGTLAATPSERERAARGRLACPKCRQAFARQEVDGAPVLSCGGCGGIWFTADGMSEFLKKAAQAGGGAVPLEIEPEETPVPTEVGCPSCETGGLDTIKVRGVALDRCWECHGIYIDLGELEEVAGPISPPNRKDPEPVLVTLLGWLAR